MARVAAAQHPSCEHVIMMASCCLALMQSMMGPYAMYGLAGAGAGLLFYFVAGRSGGPVSIPGVASKGCSGAQVFAQDIPDDASNSFNTH